MSGPNRPIATLDDFHQEVMAEAERNGLRLRALDTERRQIRRVKFVWAASLLTLLVGSLALGDVTVAEAVTTISTSNPLV